MPENGEIKPPALQRGGFPISGGWLKQKAQTRWRTVGSITNSKMPITKRDALNRATEFNL